MRAAGLYIAGCSVSRNMFIEAVWSPGRRSADCGGAAVVAASSVRRLRSIIPGAVVMFSRTSLRLS